MSQSPFSFALRYARRGFKVLPLVPHGKEPVVSREEGGRGSYGASTDEHQIQEWLERYPNANIGIALDGLLVVDIDPRNGGDETWTRLCLQHGEPETMIQQTGSAGLHYLFSKPDFEAKGKPAQGIDCKAGPGSYIVVAPSIHPCGGSYRWLHVMDPQPLPEWLAALLRRPEPIQYQRSTFESRRDKSRAFQAACRYADKCDPAIEGQLGGTKTYFVALKLVTKFPELDEGDLWMILQDYGARCVPPWPQRQLMHKLTDALRTVRRSAA